MHSINRVHFKRESVRLALSLAIQLRRWLYGCRQRAFLWRWTDLLTRSPLHAAPSLPRVLPTAFSSARAKRFPHWTRSLLVPTTMRAEARGPLTSLSSTPTRACTACTLTASLHSSDPAGSASLTMCFGTGAVPILPTPPR